MSSTTMAMAWTTTTVDVVRSGRILGIVSTFVLGGVLFIAGISSNAAIAIGFGVAFILLSVLGLIYVVKATETDEAAAPLVTE